MLLIDIKQFKTLKNRHQENLATLGVTSKLAAGAHTLNYQRARNFFFLSLSSFSLSIQSIALRGLGEEHLDIYIHNPEKKKNSVSRGGSCVYTVFVCVCA